MLVQLLRNKLVVAARKSMGKNASLGQLYGNMVEAYHQMQTPLIYQDPSARVSMLTFFLSLNLPYLIQTFSIIQETICASFVNKNFIA